MKNSVADLIKSIANNEQLMRYYAKKSCKSCIGRGYRSIQPPESATVKVLCHCVRKNAKKELSDG